MLNKARALTQVFRVLRPGGRFVCLTPNGHYIWYRRLAPLIGLETLHLSTDQFLSRRQLAVRLRQAGFRNLHLGYWTFIPPGDIPRLYAALLGGLDKLGKAAALGALRGGLVAGAVKP